MQNEKGWIAGFRGGHEERRGLSRVTRGHDDEPAMFESVGGLEQPRHIREARRRAAEGTDEAVAAVAKARLAGQVEQSGERIREETAPRGHRLV